MSHQSQRNVNDVVRYKQNLARKQPGVVSSSDDVTRGSYRVIFFCQPRFKPIGEGKNVHSCNNFKYLKTSFIH